MTVVTNPRVTGVPGGDGLDAPTTIRAASGGFAPTNPVSYFLAINNGEFLDVAIAAWVAEIRARALANGTVAGLGHLAIPGGIYAMSSTSATITLEPWMSIKTLGTIYLPCPGHTVPVFWVRNDITPQVNEGEDSDFNTRVVIDGRQGTLLIDFINNPGTATGIRYGSGDGVWGTNYTGSSTYHTIFCEFYGIKIFNGDEAIQITNNQSFCSRWNNVWVSNSDYAVVTSSSAAENITYEQHSFINCFFGNIYHSYISYNSGGARDHQISILHSSLTHCPDEAISIRTAAMVRFEIAQSRIENFDVIVRSTVASPRSWCRFGANVLIIPSKGFGGGTDLAPFIRKFFVGTFNVQIDSMGFNLTGNNGWGTQVPAASGIFPYGDASNQFMSDDTVMIMADKTYADDPQGDYTTNGNVRQQPIWNTDCARNANYGFEDASLTGTWTTGGTATITRTTTATEFYSGTAGVKVACVAQYGFIYNTAPSVVQPGKYYYSTLVSRQDLASTSGSGLFILCGLIWYRKDETALNTFVMLRMDQQNQASGFQNWANRKSATQWFMHPTGIYMRAPAGATHVRQVFGFNGSGTSSLSNWTGMPTGAAPAGAGTNSTAVFYIDNAVLAQIG